MGHLMLNIVSSFDNQKNGIAKCIYKYISTNCSYLISYPHYFYLVYDFNMLDNLIQETRRHYSVQISKGNF